LKKNQFLGGQSPNQNDAVTIKAMLENKYFPEARSYPHLYSWFAFTSKFTEPVMQRWPAAKSKTPAAPATKKEEAPKQAKPAAKKAEDDFDPFADEDPNEAPVKLEFKAKAPKKVVIAKSILLLEIKPIEAETDLDALYKRILTDL